MSKHFFKKLKFSRTAAISAQRILPKAEFYFYLPISGSCVIITETKKERASYGYYCCR